MKDGERHVRALLTAEGAARLYGLLEEEQRPCGLRWGKAEKGFREVDLACGEEDYGHFKGLIKGDNGKRRQRRDMKGQPTMEKKKKVYISGAIAHHDLEERKEAFRNAERLLERKGFEPVNPFKNGLPEEAHWREHMRADIRLLLGCEYIYMLRGWELSKGAKLELDVASSCGIEVLFEHDTGTAWHGNKH